MHFKVLLGGVYLGAKPQIQSQQILFLTALRHLFIAFLWPICDTYIMPRYCIYLIKRDARGRTQVYVPTGHDLCNTNWPTILNRLTETCGYHQADYKSASTLGDILEKTTAALLQHVTANSMHVMTQCIIIIHMFHISTVHDVYCIHHIYYTGNSANGSALQFFIILARQCHVFACIYSMGQ